MGVHLDRDGAQDAICLTVIDRLHGYFLVRGFHVLSLAWNCASGKVDKGGGFRVEGGNGFGKARDRESVADAAGSADQPQ
jgi:hypothetical protein